MVTFDFEILTFFGFWAYGHFQWDLEVCSGRSKTHQL